MQSPALSDAPLRRGRIVVATAFTALAVVYGVWHPCPFSPIALLAQSGWSHPAGELSLPSGSR